MRAPPSPRTSGRPAGRVTATGTGWAVPGGRAGPVCRAGPGFGGDGNGPVDAGASAAELEALIASASSRQVPVEPTAAAPAGPAGGDLLPKAEVVRRLRALGQPATVYGEGDSDRQARLEQLERELGPAAAADAAPGAGAAGELEVLVRAAAADDAAAAMGDGPLDTGASSETLESLIQAAASTQAAAAAAATTDPAYDLDTSPEKLGPRPDDVLPNGFEDNLVQAAEATALAISQGAKRVVVECFLPDLFDPISGGVMAEEGDQQKYWDMSRSFCRYLQEEMDPEMMNVVYPDVGVAAMLGPQMGLPAPDKARVTSLTDRIIIGEGDSLLVVANPDPPGAEKVTQVTADLLDERPIVLFNPRLASGDAGIGLNVRRMRSRFLSTFTTAYSMRPFGDGTVFKKYPEIWKVFVDDPDVLGRYLLAGESFDRPAGDDLDLLLMKFEAQQKGGEEGAESDDPLEKLAYFVRSMLRFAKSF